MFSLLLFLVTGLGIAVGAILVRRETVGMCLLILGGNVIFVLTDRAAENYVHSFFCHI